MLQSVRRWCQTMTKDTKRGRRRLGNRYRPLLESLEVRLVPTVVFEPAFAKFTAATNPPYTVLNNPSVYLIFAGGDWGPKGANAKTVNTLATDAQTILNSSFLNGLSEYGSSGTATYVSYWVDPSWTAPSGFNPGDLNNSTSDPVGQTSFTAVQAEIQKAINNFATSSIAGPGNNTSVTQSPIYVFIADPTSSAITGGGYNNGGYNVPGTYTDSQGNSHPINMVSTGTGIGSLVDVWTSTFSHEIAERMSDPGEDGSGVEVSYPTTGFPSNLVGGNQISDGEPELSGGTHYGYRLGGVGGVVVQPYYSFLNSAFIAPDGSTQSVTLMPRWVFASTQFGTLPSWSFTGKYDLTVKGDQNGAFGRPDTITVDTAGGGVLIRLNGETFSFDPNTINSITVNPGFGANVINIDHTLAGVSVTLNLIDSDTVNLSPVDHSLDDLQGDVTIHAQPGISTVNIYDQGTRATPSYELTGSSFKSSNEPSTIYYDNIPAYLNIDTVNEDTEFEPRYFEVAGDSALVTTVSTGNQLNGTFEIDDTGTANAFIINTAGPTPISVNGLSAQTALTINSGAHDLINLGHGNTQSILGTININSPLVNPDQLVVDDSHDFSQHTVTVTNQSILGLTPGNVHYGTYALGNILLEDGLGSNTFNVLSTAAQFKIGSIVVTSPQTTLLTDGSDTINVGNAGSLAGIVSGLTVNGSLDQATLNLNDQNDLAGHTVTVTSGAIVGLAPAEIDYGTNALGNLNINGSRGGSAYNVWSTQAPYTIGGIVLETTTTTITSHGPDKVNVGYNGSVQNIEGNLFVHNPPYFTDLLIDDSADATPRNPVLGNGILTGLAPAFITWTPEDLSSLTILEGSGGGVYTVQALTTATNLDVNQSNVTVNVLVTLAPLTIQGAGGNDVFNIGGPGNSLNSIQGALTFNVSGGNNTYNFNDQGTTSDHTYTITATALSRDGVAPITFSPNSDTFNFNPGSGTNTVNVESTTAGSMYNVDPGDTTFNVGNANNTLDDIQGTLSISGGAGNNIVNINDQGTITGHQYEVSAGSLTRVPFASIQPTEPPVTIFYDTTVNHVNMNIGNAGSLVFAISTAAGTTYDLYGGGNEDEYVVANNSSLDGIQGPLHLHDAAPPGGIGPVMILSDFVNPLGHIYTLQTGSLVRQNLSLHQDMAPITWDSAAEFVLFTGPGGNQVNVLSIGTPFLTAIQAQTGDTVTVGTQAPNLGGTLAGIQGTLRIQAATGESPHVILDDSGDTVARHATFEDLPFNPVTIYGVTGLGPLPIYLQMDSAASVSVLGGSGDDTFSVTNRPNAPSLTLDGGSGINTLDYSSYVGDVLVDLPLGSATGATGGIRNIRNVTGSQGNDLIVGDASPNVLIGGTGRNVLIGGAGSDTLDASHSTGDDLLIGGTTDFDTNIAALQVIMAEWDRTDLSFDQRYSDLYSGSRTDLNQLNGKQILLNKSTVHADTAPDTLTGGPGHNWFFVDADDVTNYKPTGNKKTSVK